MIAPFITSPSAAIKRRLHRDITADPVLHALVLNLYLNGEQYPHAVDDYFPIHAVEDEDLADAMRAHVADEDKHVALYTKAIQKLEQPVLVLPMADVFNHVIRTHTGASFTMRDDDGRDARRLKLAHFLAHAHWLEKRIARSLHWHVEACAQAAHPFAGKAVAAVLGDETRHVEYTRHAVEHLLPRAQAQATLRLHERAEARANLSFSATQLGRLVRVHAQRFPAQRRWLYRASAGLMKVASHV